MNPPGMVLSASFCVLTIKENARVEKIVNTETEDS